MLGEPVPAISVDVEERECFAMQDADAAAIALIVQHKKRM
jgi:hypothetical protein